MSHQEAEQEARQKEKFWSGTQWPKEFLKHEALQAENRLFRGLMGKAPEIRIVMEDIQPLRGAGVCGDQPLTGSEHFLGTYAYDVRIDQLRGIGKTPFRDKSFLEELQERFDALDAARPSVEKSFDYDVWIALDEEDDAYVDIRVLL